LNFELKEKLRHLHRTLLVLADPAGPSCKLFSMSSNTSSVYDTCSAQYGESDKLLVLQCISSTLEAEQSSIDFRMQSYLLILSGALAFFTQAGFAMICAGSVRKKNTQNAMINKLLVASVVAIAYFCFGYAFAFGGDDAQNPDAPPTTTFAGTYKTIYDLPV